MVARNANVRYRNTNPKPDPVCNRTTNPATSDFHVMAPCKLYYYCYLPLYLPVLFDPISPAGNILETANFLENRAAECRWTRCESRLQ